MQDRIAHQLNDLNKNFYRTVAESFSSTRQSAWAGWNLCFHAVDLANQTEARILDVACGNQRFADYAVRVLPNTSLTYIGIDANEQLSRALARDHGCMTETVAVDVIESALDGSLRDKLLGEVLNGDMVDLAASFGFMHHVPTKEARMALIGALVESCRPRGYCCVSFWQFLNDARLSRKAERDTVLGLDALGLAHDDLDRNDYLLGWQDLAGVFRYCHHYSNAEISELAASVSDRARVVAQFLADGRTSTLNSYLILQRTE